MVGNTPIRVKSIRKKKNRHRSFETRTYPMSNKKSNFSILPNEFIKQNQIRRSTPQKTNIEEKKEDKMLSKTTFQISNSNRNEIKTNEHKSIRKYRCLCLRHFSPIRAILSIFVLFLVVGALAALIISILTRGKDTTITRSMVSILWTFDNTTNDYYDTYNGIGVNGPSYTAGYTGLTSAALKLDCNSSSYVEVNEPLFEFTYRSFTIEMWFYPIQLTTGDFGLFGQCETMSTDQCLMIMIRNYQLYSGFYQDDLVGVTTLVTNRWYHVAFVYDYSTSTQYLYLNGYLENSRISNKYQGTSADITIGAVTNGPEDFFCGYIDQTSLITVVKTADEILYDATFVAYYSFDTSSYLDSGPWNFSLSNFGCIPANGTGRINNAILFQSANTYFRIAGLSLLGTSMQSYSIALWIEPSSVNGGTIIYLSKCNYNCASNWCMPFIGLTSSGQIVIQSWSATSAGTLVTLTGPIIFTSVWTHIVYTYSLTNGMRMYLNGILFRQSSVFSYLGSGASNYVYAGSFPLTSCSQTVGAVSTVQYYGIMDEFYIYARELTSMEVLTLANP